MNYVDKIFERMNLSQLRNFMINAVDDISENPSTYEERLKTCSNRIYERLNKIYPDGDELDMAAADLSDALVAYEEVYMEIGMKAGARIIFQLLLVNDAFSTDKNK